MRITKKGRSQQLLSLSIETKDILRLFAEKKQVSLSYAAEILIEKGANYYRKQWRKTEIQKAEIRFDANKKLIELEQEKKMILAKIDWLNDENPDFPKEYYEIQKKIDQERERLREINLEDR